MPLTENRIWSMMTSLAACLCAQINDEANGLKGVCFCGVLPGEAVPMDYVDGCSDEVCGMAYVRMSALYPSTGVGMISEQPGNCNAGIGVDLEVGILRCITGMDDSGNLPTDAEMFEAVQSQIADALAMQRAIQCCEALPSKDFILSSYAPTGPMGGVYGGTYSLSVAV
jgi:hypothetical protein